MDSVSPGRKRIDQQGYKCRNGKINLIVCCIFFCCPNQHHTTFVACRCKWNIQFVFCFFAHRLIKIVWTTWGKFGKDKIILKTIWIVFVIVKQVSSFWNIVWYLQFDCDDPKASSQMDPLISKANFSYKMLFPPCNMAIVVAWLGWYFLKRASKFDIVGDSISTLPPNFVFNNLAALPHSSAAMIKLWSNFLYHHQFFYYHQSGKMLSIFLQNDVFPSIVQENHSQCCQGVAF